MTVGLTTVPAGAPAAGARPEVRGVEVDAETRCGHYDGPTDVIAMRFRCCGEWFPCIDCHQEMAGHEVRVWSLAERDREAVLCGVCGRRLTIAEYMGCGSTCPSCGAAFNPGCSRHWHHYFEMEEPSR